jgi:O-antigen ligase
VGAGNCHLAARRIADNSPYRSEWYYTVHCKYLLVWVETGILGLAAFLAFLLGTIRQGWRIWRAGDPLLSTVALALIAGVAGHMIHMAVDVFNSRQQVQILWCCAGIVAALVHVQPSAAVAVARPVSTPRWEVTGHAA